MNKPGFNPAPLGLSGFGLTTWLLSMINAGWAVGSNIPMVVACALSFGGAAQIIAGIMEATVGNSFGFLAFCGYGSFWLSFSLFILFFSHGVSGSFVGWYLLLWAVFSTYLWVASFKKSRVLAIVFTAVTPTVYCLAFGKFLGSPSLEQLGGYLGLITAALAMYLAAADTINEAWGRNILPN